HTSFSRDWSADVCSADLTRAAVEEGIVAGGGTALVRAAEAINLSDYSESEQWGAKIVKRACEEPLRQIAANAGLDGAIVLERVQIGRASGREGAGTEGGV